MNSLAFSPRGDLLAAGTQQGRIKLWNARSRQALTSFLAHTMAAVTLAFSPDGNFLVSGSSDQLVKLWEVGT
ncbi:MAG: hypothetical protein FJ403_00825 [Verrucomicrobia bacterium]|nr:hypothetical protein [Verrucomicrobiota bacterium]